MKLSLDKQKDQNRRMLNDRLSNVFTRNEVIEFCKRARIDVCCDLIDNEVVDDFVKYYGYLPNYNNNSGKFEMIRLTTA